MDFWPNAIVFIFVLALGTWQTVEVLHHSKLCYDLRIRMEKVGGFMGDVTSCPFCLSHWVAIFYGIGLGIPVLNQPIFIWLLLLAAVRLANLGNDLTWSYNRTPRYQGEDNGNNEIEHQNS